MAAASGLELLHRQNEPFWQRVGGCKACRREVGGQKETKNGQEYLLPNFLYGFVFEPGAKAARFFISQNARS